MTSPCVCGCPPEHPENCAHGCCIPEPDNGSPSVLGHPQIETYNGIYANRKWAV